MRLKEGKLETPGCHVAKFERCKPNKISIDKWIKFYNNRSMKSWLQSSDVEMYLTRNVEKSVVAEMLFEL